MSSLRADITTRCRSSLAYCPQVREAKQLRHNALHDFSVRSVCTVVAIIVLRIQSALDKFLLTPMEHLTIDFRLIPEVVSIVGSVYSIEYHRRSIEHIAYSTRRIHSLITVRHITLVFLVDGMATCPRVTKGHCKIVEWIYGKNSMPCDLQRIEGIGILCKFPIVVRQFAVANIGEQFIYHTAHLLSLVGVNVGADVIKSTNNVFVNILIGHAPNV